VRIDTEIVSGWRTCGADRTMSDTDCPGYESEPCDVVRETITRTFGDRNRGQGAGATGLDPFANAESDSLVYVRPVNGDLHLLALRRAGQLHVGAAPELPAPVSDASR